MEVLTLIPARGGSKSVPRKNLLNLFGRPLIYWTIKVAMESKLISRIIVSTDDDEIADIAQSFKAEVIMRPPEFSGDYSRDFEFHYHSLQHLKNTEDYIPDYVVNLRPTVPYRKPEIINEAITIFSKSPNAHSLRSVHLAEQTPYKMWKIGEGGFLETITNSISEKEPYNTPRQLLPIIYWQDGYIDITRPKIIFEMKSTTGNKILPFLIDNPSQDIDYPDHIKKAENQIIESISKDNINRNTSKNLRHPS